TLAVRLGYRDVKKGVRRILRLEHCGQFRETLRQSSRRPRRQLRDDSRSRGADASSGTQVTLASQRRKQEFYSNAQDHESEPGQHYFVDSLLLRQVTTKNQTITIPNMRRRLWQNYLAKKS